MTAPPPPPPRLLPPFPSSRRYRRGWSPSPTSPHRVLPSSPPRGGVGSRERTKNLTLAFRNFLEYSVDGRKKPAGADVPELRVLQDVCSVAAQREVLKNPPQGYNVVMYSLANPSTEMQRRLAREFCRTPVPSTRPVTAPLPRPLLAPRTPAAELCKALDGFPGGPAKDPFRAAAEVARLVLAAQRVEAACGPLTEGEVAGLRNDLPQPYVTEKAYLQLRPGTSEALFFGEAAKVPFGISYASGDQSCAATDVLLLLSTFRSLVQRTAAAYLRLVRDAYALRAAREGPHRALVLKTELRVVSGAYRAHPAHRDAVVQALEAHLSSPEVWKNLSDFVYFELWEGCVDRDPLLATAFDGRDA